MDDVKQITKAYACPDCGADLHAGSKGVMVRALIITLPEPHE